MTSKLARRFFLGGASAVAIIAGAALNAATFDFSFTGAMQSDTTTQAGTYRISIGGASGGGSYYNSGGTGARILGDVYLGAGSGFSVLVGGDGAYGRVETGGGGMSYFRSGATLAVAGGGGGGGFSAGADGGAYASDGGGTGGGGAGTAGNTGGDGSVIGSYFGGGAGGGAGIDQNGGDAFGSHFGGGGGQTGPTFAGGTGLFAGGFGGGGGGALGAGSGGGGGYFGGGGGRGNFGGGGSSHFSSLFANTSMFDGGATNGAYVSIDLIAPIAPVPLPAGALLMGTALAGFGALRRRKTTKSAVNKT
jgi:hypothetical protein